MPFVTLDDNRYYYRISRKKPAYSSTAVCLHGSGTDSIVWSYQLSRLGRDVTVMAPDLPGHGKSEGRTFDTVKEYARWLERLLEQTGIDSFYLFGHSLGGAVAQQYARLYPCRIKGLVLVSTGTHFPLSRAYNRTQSGSVHGISDNGKQDAPAGRDSMRAAYEELLTISTGTLYEDMTAAASFDSSSWVHEIKAPVLVMCGAKDIITPAELSRNLADAVANGRLKIIDDAGHVVMLETTEPFNAAVKEFMIEGQET